MSFKVVSCQNQTVKLFQNAITNKRLAHAYIFTGQEGIGKVLFSKELAKAIFCQHPGRDACDTCYHCQRIENNAFSDLLFILPEKNSRIIKIEQLKYLQEFLNVRPLESKQKMVIIQSADKMNEEASNCLLKTLEEPPLYAIIILIVTSLDAVKDTIRSRCQIVRFSPLTFDSIKEILIHRFHVDCNQAEQIASLSNGSMERAALLCDTHVLEKRNWLIDRLLRLECDDNLTFSKELLNEWHIQDLEVLEEKRVLVKELLLSFLLYYRDLLVCKSGGYELYYRDWKDALVLKSNSLSDDVLFRIVPVIKTSFEYLDHNANITLLIENMVTKILHLQRGVFSV
ncbi:MAG: DNA polymerase III subunit delta' [wastewater metagenome]|nr:DNA polymerase III subunit delta' [Candidatus Loosdrechtia aerotolerans]